MHQQEKRFLKELDLPAPANQLTILTYHKIDNSGEVIATAPSLFRQQMKWLIEQNMHGICLRQAYDHLDATGCFPKRSVVLTFDDGFKSVFDQALPVLKEHGFTASFFIPNDFVGREHMMDRSDLQVLVAEDMEIGAHSVSHCDLTQADPDVLLHELAAGRQQLEQILQLPVTSLAYPFGYQNNNVRHATAQHYKLACTTELGHVNPNDERMRLRRLDTYFLKRRETWDRAVAGGLGHYWAFRQNLRNLKDRFR